MALPDWANTIYGFFFVATAIAFGIWRIFQHGVHKSIESHLEEQSEKFKEELDAVIEALNNLGKQFAEVDRRMSRIEYALYNDGKTGLINKVDSLLENQQSIKTDVEVLKAKRGR